MDPSTTTNVYFSPYRISTITCNANICKTKDIDINMALLFNKIEIGNDDHNIIWIQYLTENTESFRGVYPKKKRNSKKKDRKCRFDNQITIIYKFNSLYLPNVKIFKNGNIHLTGIKNHDDVPIIVKYIIEQIQKIYEIDNSILKNVEQFESLEYSNFLIRMINTDFKVYIDKELTERYLIRRKVLHTLLISDKYNNKCSFQPGIYHGVKLEYFWNPTNELKNGICCCTNHCFGKSDNKKKNSCKKITIAIFESGSILITGGILLEQIDDAYKYICNILVENENIIRKSNNISNI